ncbi:kinase-like domain-containing protein [Xylariaceae sp. AK1471]|nr:kinase-like domain-containing protein [Xylariaceae sp. AK1471]
MGAMPASGRTTPTTTYSHPTQGEHEENTESDQNHRKTHLSREGHGDSAPPSPVLWKMHGDDAIKPIQRHKTVTFGIAAPLHKTSLSDNKGLDAVAEYDEVIDTEGYKADLGGLESIGTSLSSLDNYGGSDGSLSIRLWEAIDNTSLAMTDSSNVGFVPERQLEQILDETAIFIELTKLERSFAKWISKRVKFWRNSRSPHDIKKDAETICGNSRSTPVIDGHDREIPKCYRKIFAILLLIDEPRAIRKFVREGVCDAHLPLVKVPAGKSTKAFSLGIKEGDKPIRLKCFNGWQRQALQRFEQRQWKVLVPFFGDERPHDVIQLEEDTILPFTYREHIRTGSQSKIFKVRIHTDYHNFNDDEEIHEVFALKEIPRDTGDHRRELQMLKRATGDHVISLLATYHYHDHYYFIFPWARCDLAVYWKDKNPEPSHDRDTLLWMARQCMGISRALSHVHQHATHSWSSLMEPAGSLRSPSHRPFIAPEQPGLSRAPRLELNQAHHRFYGLHGDIKPSNLLWFPNCADQNGMGTIKISDFGTGEFSRTKSTRRPSDSISYTPSYQAPEGNNPGPEISMSSSYDIWTLGCLFLEFITWYIGGWKLLKEFQQRRRRSNHSVHHNDAFFELTDDLGGGIDGHGPLHYAKLKPVVIEHFEKLRKSPKSSLFINDLLAIIERDMLIVEPRGVWDERCRINCIGVIHHLDGLIDRCEDDPSYAGFS